MLKVGLIGNGGIAVAHLKAYARLFESGEVEVVAICDVRPERLEKEHLGSFPNARTYKDAGEMLTKEAGLIDFVDVCTPTYLHAKHAIMAMKAGFHCICEKPMARSVAEGEEMLQASKEAGRLLMLGYCNRFFAGAQEIKRLIDERKYGRVISADFRREGGSDIGSSWFRDFSLSGGATLDFHIHDVDMIRWMFGMPHSLSMVGGNRVTEGGGYDIMSVNFAYEDGMFVNATCNWCVPNNRFNVRVIRVNFEHGYVYMERTAGREVFVLVPESGEEINYSEDMIAFDAYYGEIKYFASVIREGKALDYNRPAESLDSIRIVMAEIDSADRGGERISF